MRFFQSLLLSACAVLSAYGIGFDVFKETGDVRPVNFTIPVKAGGKVVKWAAKAGDKDISLQTSVISLYPDGSPRWYKAAGFLPSGRVEVLPLKGNAPAQKNELSVSKDGTTNSIWQISFSKKPFEVRFVRNGEVITFGAPEITLPDGSRPEAVLLEEKDIEVGKIQHIKEFSGKFVPSSAGETRYWKLRVTMWADCEFICVDPLLGVSLDKADKDNTKEMRSFKSAALKLRGRRGGKDVVITQWEDDAYEYEICSIGKKEVVKGSAGEFATAKTAVFIPEMAERFPIGATISEDNITVYLFPEIIPADRYANRKDEYIRFFAVKDGVYTIRGGVEVSFPFFVGHKNNGSGEIDGGKLSAFKKVPVALVDAEDLNKTGAWLNIIHNSSKRTALLDREIKLGLDAYFDRQKKEHWYGFMNYGDWHGERTWNWGNHEYDTAAVMFEQSLRFRDPEMFREGLRCARHQMEIDTIKRHPGKRNGGVYTHVVGHTGGYYTHENFRFRKGKEPKPFLEDRLSMGHTRIRGMVMAYLLSGDKRFYDTACLTGENISNCYIFVERWWLDKHREPGWALINLAALYWMEPSARFYDPLCDMASIVIQNAVGMGVMHGALKGYDVPPPPGGWNASNIKYRYGALGFPAGYQAAGMYLASKVIRDPAFKKEVLDNLKETAEYIKKRHYHPDSKGFTHRPCSWKVQSVTVGAVDGNAQRNVLMIDAVLTGDKESEKIAHDTLMQMFKYRELYHSPQKDENPDYPTAKNVGAIVYFVPLMMEMIEKLEWQIPEKMEYAPIRKTNWRGTVP